MDKDTMSWGGVGFLALFFLILIAFWGRGNNGFGNWGNGFMPYAPYGVGVAGYGLGFEDYKAICESEKQEIINSARTQYLTEQKAAETQAVVNATANATQTKIDFYAYQGLRDQLAETQRALMEANNKLFVKDQLAPINATLASIQCNMLRRPDVTGVGAVCPNAAIINGLGINGLNGFNGCSSCGCGNL